MFLNAVVRVPYECLAEFVDLSRSMLFNPQLSGLLGGVI